MEEQLKKSREKDRKGGEKNTGMERTAQKKIMQNREMKKKSGRI